MNCAVKIILLILIVRRIEAENFWFHTDGTLTPQYHFVITHFKNESRQSHPLRIQ